jgi:RNase H-fold protein (predicted Holliday junction resolvase)
MHIIVPGLIFDLPPNHIITLSIDDCDNNNIQEIESIVETHNIKTIVVIGLDKSEKDKKDNQKNQLKELLNTSQYINLAVENKKIKPYWASYNTSTGYVRFHHHNF